MLSLRLFTRCVRKMDEWKKMSYYGAADRNKEPIKDVLSEYIHPSSNQQKLLEISSGTGQHVSYLARAFNWVTFQPTDFDTTLFNSITSHVENSNLINVLPPLYLDAKEPTKWLDGKIKENSIDYVLNVNMMHVSEWICTEGLFEGCGRILKPGQYLFTYGPYAFNGSITPESNVRFNAMIKLQNTAWGLRDVVQQLEPLAAKNGMHLFKKHSMPANNHFLVWKKNEN